MSLAATSNDDANGALPILVRATRLNLGADLVGDLSNASEVPIPRQTLAQVWDSDRDLHVLIDGLDEAALRSESLRDLVASIQARENTRLVASSRPSIGALGGHF